MPERTKKVIRFYDNKETLKSMLGSAHNRQNMVLLKQKSLNYNAI